MIPEVVRLEHEHKFLDEVKADDIVHGYPAEKSIKGLKTSSDKRLFGLMSIFKNHPTEIKDGSKIFTHMIFQILNLLMSELIFGVIKDFF